MYFYIGVMESECFSWYALGGTEEEVKQAILDKWNERQHDLESRGWDVYIFSSVEELEENYDIQVIRLVRGQCVVY